MKIKMSLALFLSLSGSAHAEGVWTARDADRAADRSAARSPAKVPQQSLDLEAPDGMVTMPVPGNAAAQPRGRRSALTLVTAADPQPDPSARRTLPGRKEFAWGPVLNRCEIERVLRTARKKD